MAEQVKPTPEEAAVAATNIVRLLAETSSSAINVDYIRDHFELIFEDESVRLTILASLQLLLEHQTSLLTNKEVFEDALILFSFLDSLENEISTELKAELEDLSLKLIPVIDALNQVNKKREALQLLGYLGDLTRTFSIDAANNLYKLLEKIVDSGLVISEPARTNLTEISTLLSETFEDKE